MIYALVLGLTDREHRHAHYVVPARCVLPTSAVPRSLLGRTVEPDSKIQLKCSGDRGGCSRCLASSADCTYGPDGDGNGNKSTTGRSKGANRRRQRQTVPRLTPAANNDRVPAQIQHGRIGVDSDSPIRPSRSAENEDTTRRNVNDWNREGHQTSPSATSPDAIPSDGIDWSSTLFDVQNLPGLSGLSPSLGLGSTDSPIDGAPVDAVSNTVPESLPALSQTTPAAAMSVPGGSSLSITRDSGLRSPHPSLAPNRPGHSCHCLTNLAVILERLGRYRLGDKPKTANNLDCLLFCLGSGVSACDKAISCKICNVCQDHSILLATIARQLAHICNDLCGCILVYQHKVRAAANTEPPAESSPLTSFIEYPSSGNPQSDADGERLAVEGDEISFGRYQIQGVQMRLRLIVNLTALHMTDLLALLGQLSQHIGQVDGATGILTDARKTAHTAHWMLQRLRDEL